MLRLTRLTHITVDIKLLYMIPLWACILLDVCIYHALQLDSDVDNSTCIALSPNMTE